MELVDQHAAVHDESDDLEISSGNRPFKGTVGALLLKMLVAILAMLVLVCGFTVAAGTV